ncbi:centrosomal protein of 135 kDa-like [Macrobrachium nipponense]|uniref:centrosomal protein of 135 kDa-like n=1 Tax=Macrobrachium nipponense TaxID=159736 RepID=UPI0030C8374C
MALASSGTPAGGVGGGRVPYGILLMEDDADDGGECFGAMLQVPHVITLFAIIVMLFTGVFMLRGFSIEMVKFFVDFMASDSSACLDEAGNQEDETDHFGFEEDLVSGNELVYERSSNEVGDHLDSEEESRNLDASRKFEEIIKKNENVFLRFEKERLEKDRLIDELLKKVEDLTVAGLWMEEHIRVLERLNKEKERNISSMSEEMQKLRNEMAEKAKDTQVQKMENEERDEMLIILNNTVAVLEMEKDTLHRELQQNDNSRNEMQMKMNKLNQDLEGLRKENGRKEKNIEKLKRENENKTLEIRGLEDELHVLTIQTQMAQENLRELDNCKKELAEKNEELEKLTEQNLQRDREILRLENECTQKHLEITGLLQESKTVVAEQPTANGKVNHLIRRKVKLEFEKIEALLELLRRQEEILAQDTKISCLETVKILKGPKGCKEKEVCTREKTIRKSEDKKASDKTQCLRKPQINCRALYRRMDSIEEELRQIKGLQRPSAGTKRHSKVLPKTPSIEKPLNRDALHQKMGLVSAANLQRLEQEAKMVRELYKINAVT